MFSFLPQGITTQFIQNNTKQAQRNRKRHLNALVKQITEHKMTRKQGEVQWRTNFILIHIS